MKIKGGLVLIVGLLGGFIISLLYNINQYKQENIVKANTIKQEQIKEKKMEEELKKKIEKEKEGLKQILLQKKYKKENQIKQVSSLFVLVKDNVDIKKSLDKLSSKYRLPPLVKKEIKEYFPIKTTIVFKTVGKKDKKIILKCLPKTTEIEQKKLDGDYKKITDKKYEPYYCKDKTLLSFLGTGELQQIDKINTIVYIQSDNTKIQTRKDVYDFLHY